MSSLVYISLSASILLSLQLEKTTVAFNQAQIQDSRSYDHLRSLPSK